MTFPPDPRKKRNNFQETKVFKHEQTKLQTNKQTETFAWVLFSFLAIEKTNDSCVTCRAAKLALANGSGISGGGSGHEGCLTKCRSHHETLHTPTMQDFITIIFRVIIRSIEQNTAANRSTPHVDKSTSKPLTYGEKFFGSFADINDTSVT